jgi:hypothetical protein
MWNMCLRLNWLQPAHLRIPDNVAIDHVRRYALLRDVIDAINGLLPIGVGINHETFTDVSGRTYHGYLLTAPKRDPATNTASFRLAAVDPNDQFGNIFAYFTVRVCLSEA